MRLGAERAEWEAAWLPKTPKTYVDARELVRLAKEHPELVKSFVHERESSPKPEYPLDLDPLGEVNWHPAAQQLAAFVTVGPPPGTPAAFCDFVAALLAEFKDIVENKGAWELLWNGLCLRSERMVQRLSNATIVAVCKINDVDVSPESDAGRGPVDFKFSAGWLERALVEVKLSNNSNFWHGIDKQLKTYMDAEGVACGYFLVIQFNHDDVDRERVDRVHALARRISKKTKYQMTPVFVDARPKKSASKLK